MWAVGILGWLEPLLLASLFRETGGIEITEFLIIAGSQAVYLYATLVPLRQVGCFGVTTGQTEPTAATA
jgi:hypothetical protein